MTNGIYHLEQIAQYFNRLTYFTIIPHTKPDGDAMGAALGLYHYLLAKGKKPKVISPTDYPYNLKWLPGSDRVHIHEKWADKTPEMVDRADMIICVDFGGLDRINDMEALVKQTEAPKLMIDHHLDPTGFDDLRVWDSTASSTAEMVYRLIVALGDGDHIPHETAVCLYTGLLTDTGQFRFPATSPAVHRMAAHMLELGVDCNDIYDRIFNGYLESRLRVMGEAFKDGLKILPEYKTAYIMLSEDIFTKMKVNSGDTEGLVNYALGLKGVNFAALISPQLEPKRMVKFSFRSRGSFPCNQFAANFEGGGHANAAGGRSRKTMEEAEQDFLALLAEWKEKLVY